jgi:pimeloyl-ACP methyl ester carboxylesterase
MTAVATSHPDRIAGLVYLEAGYPYAFDDGNGAAMKEFLSSGPSAPKPSASDLADFSSLQKWDASVFGVQMPEAEFRQTWETGPRGQPVKARDFPGSQFFMPILTAARRPAPISTPALVIFASPHVPEAWIKSASPATQDAASAYLTAVNASTEKQANAVEQSRRATRVVRLRGAHYIFLSNEADTLREMRTFLAGLK